MKFLPYIVCEHKESSDASVWANWHRKALAAGTAVLMAFSPLSPAWATSKRAPTLPGGAAATKLAAAAAASAAGSCHLNSPRGKVSHVVTIIFDNTHFKRDPLRDGTTP